MKVGGWTGEGKRAYECPWLVGVEVVGQGWVHVVGKLEAGRGTVRWMG